MTEDDDMLAAELAFGLVDGADADAAHARIAVDPAFAQAHARWVEHAAALAGDRPEAPRPSLWTAIVAGLPANDLAAPARGDRTLRRWQASTAIAAAAAIVLGIVALDRTPSVPAPRPIMVAAAQPTPPLVAVLASKTDAAVVTVSYDPASGRLTAAPARIALGDHVPELWVIPAGGKPRALGVIAAGTPGWTRAPGAAAPAIAPGATLAISVEPAGGSPTGQPTGPVILTGTVAAATT